MKKFIAIPISLAAILTACDPATTTPVLDNESYVHGTRQYERHVEKKVGTARCEVYATDHSVSVDLKVTVLADDSYMNQQIEADFNNPTSYRGKVEFSGLFKAQSEQLCAEMKESATGMENGQYSCSGDGAQVSASFGDLDPSRKSTIVSQMTLKMDQYCDDAYDYFSETLNRLAEETGIEDSKVPGQYEKAQVCESFKVGTGVQTRVVYADKNMTETISYQNGSYTLFEVYEGFDDATLARACDGYRAQDKVTNLACVGNTIQYETNVLNGVDLDSYVNVVNETVCPMLRDGSIGFEDLWFKN